MIVAKKLTKQFGDPSNRTGGILALDETDLFVEKGEFVTIVGPSGCGKSTLLRLVAGLSTPSSGDLTVGGEHSARGGTVELAYVLQDPTLLPWRRVQDNVALPLEVRGTESGERQQRISDALDMVGLANSAQLAPRQLSGGMRMRVSIARAIATHPELLLMDEPFGALDELSRQRLNEDLSRLWQMNGWTCLFVTHNVQEAVFLSQRVLVMSARPGQFVGEQHVTFPFPRKRSLRADPSFAQLVAAVSDQLDTGRR